MANEIYVGLRSGKNWWYFEQLLNLQLEGKGEDKIMWIYPNAPYHIEKKSIPIIIDELYALETGGTALLKWETVEKKVYDYPTVTVNQSIENFKAGKLFWELAPQEGR